MTLILITGSRSWSDHERVMDALVEAQAGPDPLRAGHVALMHGACPHGADRIAAEAAEQWGWTLLPRPADWARYGRSAGPWRNTSMVREAVSYQAQGSRVACLAFVLPCARDDCPRRGAHWSHGAEHCGRAAERAGIPTTWIEETPA